MKLIAEWIAPVLLASIAWHCRVWAQAVNLADSVNTNIGGIGILLTSTSPTVQYPHGMMRVARVTTPGVTDVYLADKIQGFSLGPALLMVSTATPAADAAHFAQSFDHDFEVARPYYYAVRLEESRVQMEMTATRRAAIYRFTFPVGTRERLMLSLSGNAALRVLAPDKVVGSKPVEEPLRTGTPHAMREYFCAQFSTPFQAFYSWNNGALANDTEQQGDNIGFVTNDGVAKSRTVEVRAGISYLSSDQACRNLEHEVANRDFDAIKEETHKVWNDALGRIAISGESGRQRAIFYTALYRSLSRMNDITEDSHYFSGYDGNEHAADGHDFYVGDGLWDTYRSEHPLQLLLEPKVQQDIVRSYLRMYEQSGWLPSFPGLSGELSPMIGHHATAMIADTYLKGYRDFDVEEAYAAMKKNAVEATMLPWARGPLTALDRVYFDKGFFPALARGENETEPRVHPYERRQAVSVTLENSYDDWCLAQMAKALDKMDDYAYFLKLAHNYRNLFSSSLGLMAPKSADGNWVAGFDPKLSGGPGGRDYTTEVNTWIYTFNVQHDPAGLIELMGGRDAFNAKLDRLFIEQPGVSKFKFLGQFPDATGLEGMYAQGNEPSFHVPYLYDFSGQPWKTQKRVRELVDVWYGDGPMGIPGDDDGGETSSWYVFSAMGFYPVCPGSPVYEIGSPLFARTRIVVGHGKQFIIEARGVSAQNKYIQSAMLNDKPLSRPWFQHEDLVGGGSLVLTMGPEPNRAWGSDPADAPPSMSLQTAQQSAVTAR